MIDEESAVLADSFTLLCHNLDKGSYIEIRGNGDEAGRGTLYVS